MQQRSARYRHGGNVKLAMKKQYALAHSKWRRLLSGIENDRADRHLEFNKTLRRSCIVWLCLMCVTCLFYNIILGLFWFIFNQYNSVCVFDLWCSYYVSTGVWHVVLINWWWWWWCWVKMFDCFWYQLTQVVLEKCPKNSCCCSAAVLN